jgi:sulfonate transport system substrate-binding protein
MKKLVSLLLCLAMVLVSLTGCSAKDSDSGDFTVDKIMVTYVKAPLNVPSIVEKEKKMFEEGFSEYNLPVEYSELTAGPDQTAALASGDIQFLNAVGATSVILSAANGADIKIISMYSRSPKAFMMFSQDESINSPADLVGKTIAGPKGTNLHEMLVAYLKKGGLTLEDVNFVNMDIPSSLAALEGGSVDVALQAGPSAYQLKKDGYHMITDGEGLFDANIVVATSNKFYEENKELVKRFLETQKSILDYMDNNHDEVIELTAKETDLDTEAVEEMYQMYDFNMDITDENIASMQKTVDFMLDNGMIDKTVDIKSLILDVE